MEYHWRPCIQLVPIFWFTIRAFDAYSFEPLPNKSITGHLCMNMRPHETFQLHFFLVSFSWSTIEDPCIQLVPIFWFPIRAFDAYFFGPLPNKSITGHLCMNLGPHETFQLHFFLVSFSWSTIEDLAFNLCLFFGSLLDLSMHIFSEPLLKLIHNRPFVDEHGATWNISITFLFGEFLMEYHWRPCIQLVPIFWFPIRAFDAYSSEPLPNKSITGHLCMNMRPHETFQLHFFLVSFSWSTIEDLAFNLCQFFGSLLELLMHIFLNLCQINS